MRRFEKLAWCMILILLLVLVFWSRSWLAQSLDFLRGNPAFPLIKGKDSPPYCVGILNSIVLSIIRVVVGTLSGFLLGSSTGILLSQLPYLGRRIHRILLFFAPLAPLVWLPVLLKAIGIGNITAILIVSAGSVFVSAVVSYYLAVNCRQSYIEIVRVMGADRRQILKHVVLPSLVPMLLLLLRINFFAGWMAVLAAEMAGIDQGLGAMLVMGRSLGNYSIIALAAILIAILSFTLDRSLSILAFKIVRTRYGDWIFAKA